MKRVRFYLPLPDLILSGKKTVTWRVNDEKDIRQGDQLSLCYGDGPKKEQEFAKAEVLLAKETTFGNLSDEDKEEHEKYLSEEEMYRIYSGYYNKEIGPETKLKIIKFKLIS